MEEGFLPLVQYRGAAGASYRHPNEPEFQIDFLTPRTADNDDPVAIDNLDVVLQPLRFMEFSLEGVQQATLFDPTGRCAVARLPGPARYAVHKLLIVGERSGAFQAKVGKDTWRRPRRCSSISQRPTRMRCALPGPTPSAAARAGASGRWKANARCREPRVR